MTAELLVETDAIIERASESETAVYLYSPFHLFCISIRKNWLTFCGAPVPDTVSGSLFHIPYYCGLGDFRRFISISHAVTG